MNKVSAACKRKKNGAIEFYRFLFSCIIYVLHFRGYGNFEKSDGVFYGGYLAVEFFFIVSGALMLQGLERRPCAESAELSAVCYLFKRYKRVLSTYYSAVLFKLVANAFLISDFRLKTQLLKNFPDFLLLQAFWRPSTLNSHWWFLSAMLWASFLAYYLIQKNKDVYLYIISPFVLLFFIGYCYQTVGHIDVINNSFFLFSAFWRAFAEIGFGCMLYELYKYLEERITAPSWQMTVLEIGLLSVILIVMYRTRRDYKDFVMIFLIGALVLTTLFRRGGLSRLLDNRVSCYLGKISLGVYVNQSVFQQIIKTRFKGYPFWLMTALGLGATVLWSMLITYLWECFFKRYARK